MRQGRRMAGALVFSVLVAMSVLSSGTGAASAQPRVACEASIDGVPVGTTTWRRPIELDADRDAVVTGRRPDGATRFVADVTLGGITVHTIDEPLTGDGGEFTEVIDVGDFATFGVGLYRVEVRQPCRQVIWISITGRSPFTTAAGIGATVIGLVGVGFVIAGFARGGGCRSVGAPAGGFLIGAAALVLGQQFALAPVTPLSVLGTAVGGALLVWGVACLVDRLARTGSKAPPRSAPSPQVPAPQPPTPVPPTPAPHPPSQPAPPGEPTGPEQPTQQPTEAAEPAEADAEPRASESEPSRGGLEGLEDLDVDLEDLDLDLDDEGNTRAVQMFAEGPVEVIATEVFDVEVGIRELTGEHPELEIYIPAGPTELEIMVVLDPDEVAIVDGGPAARPLAIRGGDHYPSLTYRLSAVSVRPEFPDIEFLYIRNGEVLGSVRHHVRVAASPEVRRYDGDVLHNDAPIRPPSQAPADLTVTVKMSASTPGKLIWVMLTSHPVEVDRSLHVKSVGQTPRDFVRTAIARVEAVEGTNRVDDELFGNGTIIAANVPGELWRVLKRLSEHLQRRPRVLLLTEEPHIPWELARVPDEHVPDPTTSPLFAAQAVVGRWPRGDMQAPTPPPERLMVDRIGVITGSPDLPGAFAESERLQFTYDAEPVDATADAILDVLASPGFDVIHIALHGVHDPSGTEDGIVTPDGEYITLGQILGRGVASGAFVFLNACKVGATGEYLGDLSGVAAALIAGGATGVIAPLWAIKDDWATQVAAHFYQQVFEDGWTPGEVLRATRAGFSPTADLTSATYAAYVLYGHPNLRLRRRDEDGTAAGITTAEL